MIETVDRLDNFIKTHRQKTKDSLIYQEIQSVLKCSLVKAKEIASKHCNILSTYALLYALGYIEMSYSDFFRYLIDEDYVDKDRGFIKVKKEELFNKLGHSIKLIEYKTIEDLPEGFYQMKIENRYGTHFMAGYTIDEVLYLSDTSYRGIHVKASNAIKNDNLLWINQYVHA